MTQHSRTSEKPRIAVFAGATATILNTPPLVTSNKARQRHELPVRRDRWGAVLPDALRPQRLARAATVYVEAFSAHPLERDAASLYGPPDGFMDQDGAVHPGRTSENDQPVYAIEIRPEDGLYPLPYMARQADGSGWDDDGARPGADAASSRQPFYPDAARLFEEIDRLGVGEHGEVGLLGAQADFDFYRVIPPGGYPTGRTAAERTDVGDGDIAPERIWADYFPYRPYHLRREPPRSMLAQLTDRVQQALRRDDYAGALWLEGSPFIEESIYWLNLVIDTPAPIVACSSPDYPHGSLGA
ncbi:MAG: asparaginase domain-containing protein, partial [Candidatus Limnocylindrales bacterium]